MDKKEQKPQILKALRNNAKTPDQADDIFTKLCDSIYQRYHDKPCKEDLTLATVNSLKDILNLSKEEALVMVGAAYDLREGKV